MKDFEILEWDSNFFGHKVARINNSVDKKSLPAFLKALYELRVELIYFNSNFNIAKSGYYKNFEIDKKVSLTKILKEKKAYHPNVRFFTGKEPTSKMLELSRRIARRSRFYSDPNIPTVKVYELYEIWLQNAISNLDIILTYQIDNEVLGFAIVEIHDSNEGTIPLMGVDVNNEGKGISFILMQAIETYLLEQNCKTLRSATQSKNLKALKVYQRFGINCEESFNINHLWLKTVL